MKYVELVGTTVRVKADMLDQVKAAARLPRDMIQQLERTYAGIPGESVEVVEIIDDHRRPPSLDSQRTLFQCQFGNRQFTLTDSALILPT